jgi:hypothetical protein
MDRTARFESIEVERLELRAVPMGNLGLGAEFFDTVPSTGNLLLRTEDGSMDN